MDTHLPKGYEPAQVEQKWFDIWEQRGDFHADETLQSPIILLLFRRRM